MPNNNNQPDINKAIDVCMEEYKTLRAEILQTVQNRTNVIVFGGGLVLTLVGIGVSPIANLPIMKETTTVTRIPTNTTLIETKTKKEIGKTEENTIENTISHPKGDVSHENQQTKSTLVIKEKDTATETISQKKELPDKLKAVHDIPIERRISSAIILGIMVPASCGLIIFLVNASNHQVFRIGRYIATNIEPKINDLYFNNLPGDQKPIVWESYMQTLQFGSEEGYSVKSVFGPIQLLGLTGAVFAVSDIIIYLLEPIIAIFIAMVGNVIVANIITGIVVILFLWLLLTIPAVNDIISPMYFSIFREDSKKIAALRDGEGSLGKIWYQDITIKNENVKSTQILWIKGIKLLHQIVVAMIDNGDNAIIEIENNSLESKLQTLGEVDLANQVQNTRRLMQAQGADKQYLLNQLINELFKHIQATQIFWKQEEEDILALSPLYQIVVAMIDNRDNAIIEIENNSLESELQTLGEVDLANQVQNTRRSMQAQGADKQDLLNQLINNLFKHIQATQIFWKQDILALPLLYQIVGLMIDNGNNAIVEIENDSLKLRLETLGEFDLANQVQNTRRLMQAQGADKQYLLNQLINRLFKSLLDKIKDSGANPKYNPPFYFNLDNGGGKRVNNIPELLKLCIDNPNKFKEHMDRGDFERWLDNIEIGETELANIAQATREKIFPNDNERLHYFLRECCLVLIGRNP